MLPGRINLYGTIKKRIKKLLRLGVIQHSKSDYATASFVIPKTFSEIRIIIN